MGVGRDYAYYVYTDNEANEWSVKLDEAYGGMAALGFGAYDASKPLMPRGMKMRGINVMDLTTKMKRRVPVGEVTATAWTDFTTVITVPAQGDADGIATAIQSRYEETPARKAHPIANY